MTTYQAWLPDNCLSDTRLAEPVSTSVDNWCSNWFAGPSWLTSDNWTIALRTTKEEEDLSLAFRLENGLSCWLTTAGKASVARSMLNLADVKNARNEMDARFLNTLSQRALADLSERLQALRPAQGAAAAPVEFYALTRSTNFEIKVADKSRQAMMFIQADADFVVQTARDMAPPARSNPAASPRKDALDLLQVAVGARLGQARLTLSQIENLGVGDVISFDTLTDAPLDLTINGVTTAADMVSVQPENENLTLILARPVS